MSQSQSTIELPLPAQQTTTSLSPQPTQAPAKSKPAKRWSLDVIKHRVKRSLTSTTRAYTEKQVTSPTIVPGPAQVKGVAPNKVSMSESSADEADTGAVGAVTPSTTPANSATATSDASTTPAPQTITDAADTTPTPTTPTNQRAARRERRVSFTPSTEEHERDNGGGGGGDGAATASAATHRGFTEPIRVQFPTSYKPSENDVGISSSDDDDGDESEQDMTESPEQLLTPAPPSLREPNRQAPPPSTPAASAQQPQPRQRKSSLDWARHQVRRLNTMPKARTSHQHQQQRSSSDVGPAPAPAATDAPPRRKSKAKTALSNLISAAASAARVQHPVGQPTRSRQARLIVGSKGILVTKPVRRSSPLVQRKAARGAASRHAKTLEQMMKASTEHPLSEKQVRDLKKALMDARVAGDIIGELRAMDVDLGVGGDASKTASANETATESSAQHVLQGVAQADKQQRDAAAAAQARAKARRRATRGAKPLKAVCLNYTEQEASSRQSSFTESDANAGDKSSAKAGTPAAGLRMGGVSPVSLLLSPGGSAALVGLDATGVMSALGEASGSLIRSSGTDAGVHPPLDRMAIFTFWWGFELTLPAPSMSYLSTAHSVSGAFLTFLSTMVVTGGVPELLPFIKYFSVAVDFEFQAIKSADRGKGVVIAATWAMPLALVPRAWDYDDDDEGGSGAAGAYLPLPQPQAQAQAGEPAATTAAAATTTASAASASTPSTAAATPGSTQPSPRPRPRPRSRSRSNSRSPRSSTLSLQAQEAAIHAARTEPFPGDLAPPAPHAHGHGGGAGPPPASAHGHGHGHAHAHATPRGSIALERLKEEEEGAGGSRIDSASAGV